MKMYVVVSKPIQESGSYKVFESRVAAKDHANLEIEWDRAQIAEINEVNASNAPAAIEALRRGEGTLVEASVAHGAHQWTPEEAAEQLEAEAAATIDAAERNTASKWLDAIIEVYFVPGKRKPGPRSKELVALAAALKGCGQVSRVKKFRKLRLLAAAFEFGTRKNRRGRRVPIRLIPFELEEGETIAQAIQRRALEVVGERQ